MKRIMGIIVAAAILMQSFVAVHAADYLLNETFDNQPTNKETDVFTADGEGTLRVVENGKNDKELLVKGEMTLKKDFGKTTDNQMVLSMDALSPNNDSSFIMGIYDKNGAKTTWVNVKNASVISPKGNKVLQTVSNQRSLKLTVLYDKLFGVYNLYANGRCIWKNERAGHIDAAGFFLQNTRGDLKIDNVYAYEGDDISRKIQSQIYLNDGIEFIDINDDVGGFLFFHNAQMATDAKKYNYVTFAPKSNKYTASLLKNWTDKNRTTEITLDKTTGESIYMDITTTKHKLYNSTRQYSFFLIDGDFKRTNMAATAICVMRDQSGSANQDITLWSALSNGSLKVCNGKTIPNVFKKDTYVNIKAAIDVKTRTVDFYINDVLKIKDASISNNNFSTATGFRFGLGTQTQKGDLIFDNTKIVGLENPYVPGENYRTTTFYDDAPVGEWLKDKIAFHYYAQNVTVNGQKNPIALRSENDELYAAASDLNNVLDWQCEGESVAIKAYAKQIGLDVFDDRNGMIILSKDKMYFDLSGEIQWHMLKEYKNGMREDPTTIEALNDYLFFERPEKETLLRDFKAASENTHPRVYGTKADFDRLRALRGNDAYFDGAADKIIAEAEKLVAAPENTIDYIFNSYRMYDQAVALDNRMNQLGFAYQLTGDKKYAQRAWKEFEVVLTFPDINPAHIIDSGAFLTGIAVGYDWMYDAFTPEQRKQIEEFAIKKGIRVMSGIYYGDFDYRNFISAKWVSNFNTIINAGISVASIAFMDVAPDLCAESLEMSIRSIEYTLKGFAPDGAWSEGTGYWNMTTQFLVYILMSLDSALDTDYGLSKYQGLSDTADFYMSVTSYGGANNYHDSAESKQRGYKTFGYFAKKFENYGVYASRKYETTNHPGIYVSADTMIHPMELLCYTEELQKADESTMDAMPKGKYYRGVELFTFRDSYYKEDGIYLSAHAGAVSGYHTQNDTGTFVLDHLGERWAMDLGVQNYNVAINYVENFRKRTDSHNTLVINNHEGWNQLENTFAPITRFESNDASGIAVMDMSEIYADADSAVRGFYITDNYQSVTIRDELDLNKNSEIYWFMNSRADMRVIDGEVLMSLNGKQMTAKVNVDGEGLQKYDLSITDCAPLPESPNPPGQDSNEGVRRITVKVNGNGKVNITVKLSPTGSKAESMPMILTPISDWKLLEKTNEDMAVQTIPAAFYAEGEEFLPQNGVMTLGSGIIPNVTVVPQQENIDVKILPAQSTDEPITVILTDLQTGMRNVHNIGIYDPYVNGLTGEYKIVSPKSFEVTSEPEEANAGKNINDNNFTTRWTTLNQGESVTFDLGEVRTVSAVALSFWKGATRSYGYEVLVSEDGANYTSVLKGNSDTAKGEQYNIIPIAASRARFVKITGWGNTDLTKGANTNILECRILDARNGG